MRMSRPPRRRSPPQVCPEPPRIRSHTPPLKRGGGQRSLERRARSPPPPMRVKRNIRNNSPPHRSRSPIERRSKGGPPLALPARNYAPIPRNEREPLREAPRREPSIREPIREAVHREPPIRPRGKRNFQRMGSSETTVAPRTRHRSRSPVTVDEGSRSRLFSATDSKHPFNDPISAAGSSNSDRNKFKDGADFQCEEDELEKPIFRGPDSGDSGYDASELKRIKVQIFRKIKSEDDMIDELNRSVPDLEEITPVRRNDSLGGCGDMKKFSSQNRNARGIADLWNEDPTRTNLHFRPDEGKRPIFERYSSSKNDKPDYNQWNDGRSLSPPHDREKSRSDGPSRIDGNQYFPPERERDSHISYGSQKLSHEIGDGLEKRICTYGRSGDDLRQTLERRRDDSRGYAQSEFRNEPHEKQRSLPESDLRGRMNDRRADQSYKRDERERDRDKDRPRERERERIDYPPPRRQIQDRRRGSPSSNNRRPLERDTFDRDRNRGEKDWEREKSRDVDIDKRRRPRSRERDEERRETRPRDSRPRNRADDRPEHRGSYKHSDYSQDKEEEEEEEYETYAQQPMRGRGGWGGPPGRGMMRGGPRGGMGVVRVMRPLPPPYQPVGFFPPPVRPIMPFRGYPPRFPPPFFRPFFM